MLSTSTLGEQQKKLLITYVSRDSVCISHYRSCYGIIWRYKLKGRKCDVSQVSKGEMNKQQILVLSKKLQVWAAIGKREQQEASSRKEQKNIAASSRF